MSTVITRAEVKKHRHRNNLWLIIHDEVYDVTKFVEEHPGGEDTLLDGAGTDATQSFEDVGHSEDARELLKQYKIGILPDDEKTKQTVKVCCDKSSKSCMNAHRMTKKDASNRQSIASGKGSCSDCTSVSSCLAANRPPVKKSPKNWRNFDAPDGGSVLTSKSSKSTRFVVPPDKCDEVPTSTAAPSKVVIEKENSHHPRTKKKKKGSGSRIPASMPLDVESDSRILPLESGGNWKWWALAAFIIGAIAVGAMVVKKNS